MPEKDNDDAKRDDEDSAPRVWDSRFTSPMMVIIDGVCVFDPDKIEDWADPEDAEDEKDETTTTDSAPGFAITERFKR